MKISEEYAYIDYLKLYRPEHLYVTQQRPSCRDDPIRPGYRKFRLFVCP